jgi:hypothetical protein
MSTRESILFASSYPYFCSHHTPVFQGSGADLKHKRKHQKFDVFSQHYNVFVNVKVRYGKGLIRMECLCLPLSYEMQNSCETILNASTNFEGCASFMYGARLKIGGWNYPSTKIECFVEKESELCVSDRHWIELNAKKIECIVYLSDMNRNVEYVSIYCCEPCIQERDAPHDPSPAEIHNLCGYCIMPCNISFDVFHSLYPKRKQRGISSGDCVLNTNGNFVLCGRKNQLDFRGVRSISLMKDEMFHVCEMNMEELDTYVYMIVLKGSVGKALILNGIENFLYSRIGHWCECIFHAEEVCDVLEITNINWSVFQKQYPSFAISKWIVEGSKSVNIFVSRKGGTILRVTFPKNEKWDIVKEYEILNDSNIFLNILHFVLLGKL